MSVKAKQKLKQKENLCVAGLKVEPIPVHAITLRTSSIKYLYIILFNLEFVANFGLVKSMTMTFFKDYYLLLA